MLLGKRCIKTSLFLCESLRRYFILRQLLPMLTLLFIFILTPLASATTPLGLTQSDVDRLSGYGQEGYMDKTKFAIDYRQFAGGSLDRQFKPTAHFQLVLENEFGDVLRVVESPKYNDLEVQTPKLMYSVEARNIGLKVKMENLSTPYSGRTINMYDIQHRFVPEGRNRDDYPIQSYDPTKVTSWSKVQEIINDAIRQVNENGTLEIYLAVSDRGEPYNNLANWSANGNVATIEEGSPEEFPNGFIWYFTGMEIEFADEYFIDVVTTEPVEIPEDWEIDTHLGTGKVVTNQGMANLADKAHDLDYYQDGDKVMIDFTFWNTSDNVSIHPPMDYAIMYWEYPNTWTELPSNYHKYYVHLDTYTGPADIFPRGNAGPMSYEYTINVDDYPFELTTGKKINELSANYPPELKAKVNPCKDEDVFITLAVIADPEAVLNPHHFEPGQEKWISLNTNIMVVHIPIAQGLDISAKFEPTRPYWEIPIDVGHTYVTVHLNGMLNLEHNGYFMTDGFFEASNGEKREFNALFEPNQQVIEEPFTFKVTAPGRYRVKGCIPALDELGNPKIFEIDGEEYIDIDPTNNCDEIEIEVRMGGPKDETPPDYDDPDYDGDEFTRPVITG